MILIGVAAYSNANANGGGIGRLGLLGSLNFLKPRRCNPGSKTGTRCDDSGREDRPCSGLEWLLVAEAIDDQHRRSDWASEPADNLSVCADSDGRAPRDALILNRRLLMLAKVCLLLRHV